MAGFVARKLKQGLFEIVGLEKYLEQRFAEFKQALLQRAPAAASTSKPRPAPKAKAKPVQAKGEDLSTLMAALAKHPRKAELLRAGKEKDQLIRSLVPLYVARNLEVSINSGMISRFWKENGITYAAPNAAKALRQHVGYARKTKLGLQITPNGVRWIEAALKKAA